MTKKPGDIDPRVARTRQAVLQAAEKLLFEGGPAELTYTALSEASGVGRATLYRHWPTIQDLWTEMAAMAVRRIAIELSGDLRTDLTTALRLTAARIVSDGGVAAFVTMLERSLWDEQTREFLESFQQLTPVSQALRKAVEVGTYPASEDLNVAASFLLGPLMHRGILAREPIDDAFIKLVVDRFMDTVP
jgi:AcrR family transcriptional regulator